MTIKTFRFRLTVIYTVVVVFIFSVFAFVIYLEYRKGLLEAVDKDLLKIAKTEIQKGLDPKDLAENEVIIRKYGGEYFEVVNRGGEVLITALDRDSGSPADMSRMEDAFRGLVTYTNAKYRGERFRILYFPVDDGKILRAADSLEDREKVVGDLERLFVLLFPFIFGVSSVMSWFLAGKSLDPVIKIRSLAEEIRQGRLSERINIGVKGKEIDDLVRIFNEMLDNIQRAMEAQKRFTSDVAHEIRSPLTSLRGSIEVTLRKRRPTEEYEDVLRGNLSDIVRLSKITDNLLFLSRADNNIMEMRMQWFDIGRLLESVVSRLRPKAESAGVSVVERQQEGVEMRGDVDLLEQAFTNLVDNAIKYTPSGGSVEISSKEERDVLEIVVRDSGIGIPEEDIPHIFERFYRVNKERSRKLGGTGLGLAITKWIVAAHNGTIAAKSAVGQGSEFTVIFPRPGD
jgi:heavy metal sensor kinase